MRPSLPLSDEDGNRLLELDLAIAEADLGLPAAHPLTHALVLGLQDGKALFVLNRYRGHWELPGGVIDPGETPRQAAERELDEESGQRVPQLKFIGRMTVWIAKTGRTEHGALFGGELEPGRSFRANDEASRAELWDFALPLGAMAGIDVALADWGRDALS